MGMSLWRYTYLGQDNSPKNHLEHLGVLTSLASGGLVNISLVEYAQHNPQQQPTPSNGSAPQSRAAPPALRVLGMRTRSFNKTGFDWLIDWYNPIVYLTVSCRSRGIKARHRNIHIRPCFTSESAPFPTMRVTTRLPLRNRKTKMTFSTMTGRKKVHITHSSACNREVFPSFESRTFL